MIQRRMRRLRHTRSRRTRSDHDSTTSSGLHWLAAGMLATSGAALARSPRRGGSRATDGARRATLAIAPLAGAAHALRAHREESGIRTATRALSVAAAAVGAVSAGMAAHRTVRARGRTVPSAPRFGLPVAQPPSPLVPLVFGLAGALGLVLDHDEREDAKTHAKLARRGRFLDRIIPRRRSVPRTIVVRL